MFKIFSENNFKINLLPFRNCLRIIQDLFENYSIIRESLTSVNKFLDHSALRAYEFHLLFYQFNTAIVANMAGTPTVLISVVATDVFSACAYVYRRSEFHFNLHKRKLFKD
jgi:hypothetical protein